MQRQRRPGAHVKHAGGRKEKVARGAAREPQASAAWWDGGGLTEDGAAGVLPWSTNSYSNAGVVEPRPVHYCEKWRARLETIDRREGRN